MLRWLVVVLVLANAAYFAWSQGYLRSQGLAPQSESEPQRLQQQLQPQGLKILSASQERVQQARQAEAAQCLQSDVLDEAQAAKLRSAAQAGLPQGSWWFESAVVPARWILYMGRYPDKEALENKKTELRKRQLSFQALTNRALEPGLSLGSYASKELAEQALEQLARQGIRTARPLQEHEAVTGQRLRLPAVDASLRGQLESLQPALGPLQACR